MASSWLYASVARSRTCTSSHDDKATAPSAPATSNTII